MCVTVPNLSLLPDPPLASAEVWVNVGPGQGHPAEELTRSRGMEQERQRGDGVFVAQSLCIPRVLSPPNSCHAQHLRHSGADVPYSSLPALAHPSQPSGKLHVKKHEQNFNEAQASPGKNQDSVREPLRRVKKCPLKK